MLDIWTFGYGTQTYKPLTPYLKGLHLTIDCWHPDRDDDGLKVSIARLKSSKVSEADFFLNGAVNPSTVKP